MNTTRFYGRSQVVAGPIPDTSDDSELSSESDDEVTQEDAVPVQTSSDDDSSSDEDVQPAAQRGPRAAPVGLSGAPALQPTCRQQSPPFSGRCTLAVV